ncbi:MAG TPA: YihY/virulence factor BrkB family protein [Kofleriaceae bacterium]|nr:YihY/virulence factor BrkB family protein [Kofleriaceae bacterium]
MQVRRFFRQLGHQLLEHDVTDVGAMLAYYAMLALFPMVFFVLSISLLVIPEATIRHGVSLAGAALPGGVRSLLTARADSLIDSAGAGFAIVGLGLALWGASRGTNALIGALDRLFDKRETRSWLHRQLLAIAVTFGVALIIVIALGLMVAGSALGDAIGDRLGLGHAFRVAWTIAEWAGAGVLVMVVWAIAYKFLPDTDAPFRVFTPGACCGVALWLGISYLFGLYFSHFQSYEKTYGALGGAIAFLTWLWLSNIALLVGAEINHVLADLRAPESPGAAKLADKQEHAHAV